MKKRVLSALLAICLTLSLAGAAFAENEESGASSSAASQAVSSVEPESQAQDKMASSSSASDEDQTTSKTGSTPAPTQTPAASDVTEEEPESTVAPEATEEPEATAEPDATPAPTEDPEAEVTEKTETDGSVEYTAALETDGETMNVIVTAPEGAFAQDVQPELSVTMLTAEDELNDVADKLDTAKVQYDGFTALDITFTDKATGEEIEPVKEVSVRIELPQAIVDSGIDLNTLAVQHLEEDENGDVKNVNEVATLDNGITLSEEAAAAANEAAGVAPMSDMPAEEATAADATETPAAVAEFDVDGFSTFTITWIQSGTPPTRFVLNTMYLANVEGEYKEFLADQNGDVEVSIPSFLTSEYDYREGDPVTETSEQISLTQYATTQNGFGECLGIHYGSPDGPEVDSVQATASGTWKRGWFAFIPYWYVDNVQYTLTFYKDGQRVESVTIESSQSVNVCFLYNKEEGSEADPTEPEDVSVTTYKKADLLNLDENQYTLTLGVSGDRGKSGSDKVKADILFIIDRSSSMWDPYGGQGENSDKDRMEVLQEAVDSLVTEIQNNSDSIDARYAAVQFGTGDINRILQNWTSSGDYLKGKVDNIKEQTDVGTNYQAGIRLAKQVITGDPAVLNSGARADAAKYVIFITDGEPTYSYDPMNSNNESSHGSGSSMSREEWEYPAKEIEDLNCDYFYAIGVSSGFNEAVLESLCGEAGGYTQNFGEEFNYAKVTGVNASFAKVYAATETETLEKAFRDIASDLTFFAAKNVKMIDPLSDYAEISNAGTGVNFDVWLTKLSEDGKSYTEIKRETISSGEESDIFTTIVVDEDGNEQNTQFRFKPVVIDKTIQVELMGVNGQEYELAPGYQYFVSTTIQASDKAVSEGMGSQAAENIPEDDTGTHSIPDINGQKGKGFWSNINYDDLKPNQGARVEYEVQKNAEQPAVAGEVGFPKPVIQVTEKPTGSIKIIKDVEGIADTDSSSVNGTTFNFKIEKVELDTNHNYETDTEFDDEELGFTNGVMQNVTIQGEGSKIIENLPEGTYRVTEINPPAINANKYNGPTVSYTVVQTATQIVSVAKGETTEIKVTNEYSTKKFSLTIEKNVTGDMGDRNEAFTFTVTGIPEGNYSGSQTVIDPVSGEKTQEPATIKVEEVNGELQFKLKDGQTVTFQNLAYGNSFTVTEKEIAGYEQSAHKDGSGTANGRNYTCTSLEEDTTVTFTNHKELVGPPTGLERNDKPYALMIGVAMLAGLSLAGGMVVRRRRRWME